MDRLSILIFSGVFCTGLGAVGGALLAGPFWLFGAMVGAVYAAPAGIVIGAVAALKRWRSRSMVISWLVLFFATLAMASLSAPAGGSGSPDSALGSLAAATLFALLAGHIAEEGARAKRNLRTGFCHVCDYNLRGNASGRCPECGTAIPHHDGPGSEANTDRV